MSQATIRLAKAGVPRLRTFGPNIFTLIAVAGALVKKVTLRKGSCQYSDSLAV